MLLRRWKKLSIRQKAVLLLLFAVFLPTIIMFLGQYKAFSELRDKSKSSFENNLRQKFSEIEGKAENRLLENAETTLKDFPANDLRAWYNGQIKENLAAILAKNKNIEAVFFFDSNAQRFNVAVNSRTNGFRIAKEIVNPGDVFKSLPGEEDFALPLIAALQSPSNLQNNREYITTQMRCEKCAAENHPPTELVYLYRVFTKPKEFKDLSFVGVRLNPEYVINEILSPAIADAVLVEAGKKQDAMIFGVFDERGELLYANTEQKNLDGFEMQNRFGRVFPFWTIAGSFRDSKISDLTDYIFRIQISALVLVSALLVFGVMLLLRVARREFALTEAKSAFVSNVSHELKTPLSLIRLFAETLQSGRVKNPDKIQEYYRIIGSETRRLTMLIDNILDFSAIEAGRKNYNFAPCDLAEVVAEVVQNYSYSLENSGFKVVSNFEENLPLVNTDCNAVSQAVLNLLNNAAKYSSDDKYVEINVRRRNGNVVIEVTDHGIGIAPFEQEKIFEDFYRVGGASDVHNVKGSGLGLSLVKHIVEAHGGRISVNSVVNRGSTFTIALPIIGPNDKAKAEQKML